MTQERIEELERLRAAGTQGPWRAFATPDESGDWAVRATSSLPEGGRLTSFPAVCSMRPQGQNEANAALIVAAVNALPELLAMARRVGALEAENAKLKAALEPDMFWDQDNPEQPHYDIEELFREQDYDRDRDIIIDTQEAIRCEDGAYFCRINSPSEDSETDDEDVIIRRLTDDERKQWRAVYRVWLSMQYLKPLFARTTLKEQG